MIKSKLVSFSRQCGKMTFHIQVKYENITNLPLDYHLKRKINWLLYWLLTSTEDIANGKEGL